MKQYEIRNGDWVLYHSAPIKVAETELELFSAWDMEGHFLGKIPYEDAAPIPLTKEILEENGWQLYERRIITVSGVEWHDYINKNNALEIRLGSSSITGRRFGAYWFDALLKPFDSVHELQHLLWVLDEDYDLKIV